MASIPIELKRKHTHKVITPQACRYLISVQGDRSPVNCDGNICVPFSMGRKRKVQDTKRSKFSVVYCFCIIIAQNDLWFFVLFFV